MALALAAYLVRHGTPQDRITILTGYTAQLSHIEMARRRENWLQNIKVAVVDNYKGEENDVVILSLVRNSKLSSIGFLSNEKRICVALTRAKLGLFVLGDMELFSHERSLWRNVSQTLTQNQTGIAFQVTCPYPKLVSAQKFPYTCQFNFSISRLESRKICPMLRRVASIGGMPTTCPNLKNSVNIFSKSQLFRAFNCTAALPVIA